MTTRPTILATEALVATGHPLASVSAFELLRSGGNAVDAAIAAAAVLAVVQPEMCGVGGDAFLLIRGGRDGVTRALNGSGAAPAALRAGEPVPRHGARSATVPGAVAAWEDALTRYGTRGLDDVLRPAIALAASGFPVSERVAAAFAASEPLLRARADVAATYLPAARPPRAGELFALPALARTLREIAAKGAHAFYRGDLAERIAAGTRAAGGVLERSDLDAHRSIWADPIEARYRGRRVLVQPPVSQGVVALEELAIVAHDDLPALGLGSAELLHLLFEAARLAFLDRDRYLGDPVHAAIDVRPFLDEAHAAELRGGVDPRRAGSRASTAATARGGTSYLCVVDRDGNAVSLIQSIFGDFGCAALAGDTGVLLNDRVGGFSDDPSSSNALAPGKRPLHTLNNCIVLDESRELDHVMGTPGTDAQVQTLFQLLVARLDFGVELQEAIELPRWRREGDGSVLVESRFAAPILAALEARGHRLVRGQAWEPRTGGAQAIFADRGRGVLHGAADPRREGYALGW